MSSSSTSPSSVRWHYNLKRPHEKNPFFHPGLDDNGLDDDDHRLSAAWDVPSAEEMKRRSELRQRIREETLQHRRIHRHGGMKGRNICFVLQDRQVTGKTRGAARGFFSSSPQQQPNQQNSQSSSPRHPQQPSPQQHQQLGWNSSFSIPVASSTSIRKEIQCFAEYCSVLRYHSAFLSHLGGQDVVESLQQQHQQQPRQRSAAHSQPRLPNSSKAISTISIAFSPNAKTMASTHGDHTVKITCCASGHLLETLEGHPRTPWTVKYHPTDPAILASGCLGHQVRLWNWTTKTCMAMIRLEFAIISLSFHPTGQVLAIANGTRLHFWSILHKQQQQQQQGSAKDEPNNNNARNNSNNYYTNTNNATNNPSNGETNAANNNSNNNNNTNVMTEVEQRHMLRCVHFPPNGNTIIVGGVNPPTSDSSHSHRTGGGVSGGGMSFYLRLWDFDLQAALRPGQMSHMGLRRRVIGNPRTFVPRALLYNDGGFDVSPDGKTLCACAEYWLPDGVDSAMELLRQQQEEDDYDGDDDDECHDEDETIMNGHDNDDGDDSTPIQDDAQAPQQDTIDSAAAAAAAQQVSPPRAHADPMVAAGQAPSVPRAVLATPQTPPASTGRSSLALSPPSPPGRRFAGGLGQPQQHRQQPNQPQRGNLFDTSSALSNTRTSSVPPNPAPASTSGFSSSSTSNQNPPIPPPPPPGMNRPPNPFSTLNNNNHQHHANTGATNNPIYSLDPSTTHGRYVPHVVTISLDTTPVVNDLVPGRNFTREHPHSHAHNLPHQANSATTNSNKKARSNATDLRPRLGQLLEACPLDGAKASAVTCVKFSPSTNFCLIGYGVRETLVEHNGNQYHPVTALYKIKGGMTHVSTMLSGDDDVNIARFHPDSGYGFVYGTKQGRVRVLSPRPWNYYNC